MIKLRQVLHKATERAGLAVGTTIRSNYRGGWRDRVGYFVDVTVVPKYASVADRKQAYRARIYSKRGKVRGDV